MNRAWKPIDQRFWPKVSGGDFTECWLWTASLGSEGYGQISEGGYRGRNLFAHRVAYELMIGPIPDGLQLDHLCRVRHCVNPWHLEPVTGKVNTRRSPACPANRTHCPHGHEYNERNTYRSPSGRRNCRPCGLAAQYRYQQRRQLAGAAA